MKKFFSIALLAVAAMSASAQNVQLHPLNPLNMKAVTMDFPLRMFCLTVRRRKSL